MTRPLTDEPRPLTPTELRDGLAHFTGTEHYYRTHPGLLATDGAKFLADEAGAYWLLDIVWSVLPKLKDEFAVLQLKVQNREGNLKVHNGRARKTIYHRQSIPYTDFPLPSIKLYLQRAEEGVVVMLPSEY